ncbi:MAG: hypothetical protein IJW97_07800 [Clostridia bacterium]|nr:hypothetical protein [Clostridia bacterium]
MRLPGNRRNPFGNRGLERHYADEADMGAKKRLMLMLFGNSIIILAVYFILNSMNFWPIFFIYMGIAAVLVLIYTIYNRGFVYKGVTPDMLPDTMTAEEKRKILTEAAARMKKTRWMLTLIIPFLLAFMLDALYLFLLEDLMISLGLDVGAATLLPVLF